MVFWLLYSLSNNFLNSSPFPWPPRAWRHWRAQARWIWWMLGHPVWKKISLKKKLSMIQTNRLKKNINFLLYFAVHRNILISQISLIALTNIVTFMCRFNLYKKTTISIAIILFYSILFYSTYRWLIVID